LLTDTVGFIRKLPHQLVECFKSTLDEIREADLLLHIVDVSHVGFEDQINIVHQTLKEIGARDKPILLVFNKIDELKEPFILEDETIKGKEVYIKKLKKSWMAKENNPVVFISAFKKINFNELRDQIELMLSNIKPPAKPDLYFGFENKSV
jgi:GTP-binding protein HflX